MNLFEHPDFEQAILQAVDHSRGRGWRPAIIEKDYYVTEALRIIATTAGDRVILKGGTSLAKGWNLIERFSEDIDIFLDPCAFQPPLVKNAINRELKRLRGAIAAHPAFAFLPGESETIGGFGRNDRFAHEHRDQVFAMSSFFAKRLDKYRRPSFGPLAGLPHAGSWQAKSDAGVKLFEPPDFVDASALSATRTDVARVERERPVCPRVPHAGTRQLASRNIW